MGKSGVLTMLEQGKDEASLAFKWAGGDGLKRYLGGCM